MSFSSLNVYYFNSLCTVYKQYFWQVLIVLFKISKPSFVIDYPTYTSKPSSFCSIFGLVVSLVNICSNLFLCFWEFFSFFLCYFFFSLIVFFSSSYFKHHHKPFHWYCLAKRVATKINLGGQNENRDLVKWWLVISQTFAYAFQKNIYTISSKTLSKQLDT